VISTVVIENAVFQVQSDVVLERNNLAEREFGTLNILTNRKERFETYDRVDVEVNGVIEQFLIQSDQIVKHRHDIYEHNITLMENIAKFDAVYPADRSFTRVPAQTLGQILNAYKRELQAYHNIQIDYSSIADWPNVVMTEKEFVGLNFSTILADLFRRINAHPKAARDGDTWVIFPKYYSERNNPMGNDVAESVISRMQSNDYATMIKSQIKNGIYEDYEEVWFPSENGYVLPKSSTPQVKTSSLRYELDSPIIQVTKAIIPNIPITLISDSEPEENFLLDVVDDVLDFIKTIYRIDNEEPQSITEVINTDVDITDYVVPDEVFRTLDTIEELKNLQKHRSDNNKNYVFYQIGSRYIENLFTTGSETVGTFFTDDTTFLKNAINRVLYKEYVLNGPYKAAYVNLSTRNIPLRVQYIRQRDLDITHQRQYLGAMNPSTFLHAQRDSFVEISRYKQNLKALSNRLGNETKDKTRTINYNDTPYVVGDFDNQGRVIVRVKNTYRNNEIMQEYTLAKNYANIDSETALSRQPSPFTINRKRVQTNVIVNEYVEISATSKTNTSRLTNDARKTALRILNNTYDDSEAIHFGLFRPQLNVGTEEEINGIVMPVFSGSGGNTMSFHVYFEDVQKAGDRFTTNFAKPIAYTYIQGHGAGQPGTLEDYSLFYTSEVNVQDTGSYPLNNNFGLFANNALTDTSVIEPIDLDVNASFAQTYQIHFISDDEDIILGDAFAKYNFLHRKREDKQIKLYKSTKPFTIYDKHVRTQDTQTTEIVFTLNEINQTITFDTSNNVDYFALCLDDEILIAFNKPLLVGQAQTYYFNFIEQVQRTLSNKLVAPLLINTTVSDTSITLEMLNFNSEAVDFEVTLFRGIALETQQQINVLPNTSKVFVFNNLDYAQDYNVLATSEARPGSSLVDSKQTSYLVTTALKNVLPPVVNLIRRTETTATFEFSNPNNFQVDVRAYINDTLLTEFTERNFTLTLDANAQTVQADITALEKQGYYEILFDFIYNLQYPRVTSAKTDIFTLEPAEPPLPMVTLVDDSDTTTSQFKMRYALASTAPYSVNAYVSVNNAAYANIGEIAPGENIEIIYTEQSLGIQLAGADTVPVAVYYEYTVIGTPSLIQDRVNGHTRPNAPTFTVENITPYEAEVHVFNNNISDNGFARLQIPSLGISTNVPSGNFYVLDFDLLVPNETYAYNAYITFANLDSATTEISFTTLDGPAAAPTLSRVNIDTTTSTIKIRFYNNDNRTVTMSGGIAGRQLEQIGNVAGGSYVDKIFADLKPGSRYEFSGQARTGTQSGPVTDFTTYTRPSNPQAQLVGTDVNSATFRLFNGGNDYAVDVYTGSSNLGTVESGDYLEYTRTGLSENTTYTQTFFNRFQGLDSATDSETYTTIGTPNPPTLSVQSATTTSITPRIQNPNSRIMTVLATFNPPTYLEIGNVSGNNSIVGFTFTDTQLEANHGVTYYAYFKDFVFNQYQSSTTQTTLYTAPLAPTNINVVQATTGGLDYVALQVDFFNPNDQFGSSLSASMKISQPANQYQETFNLASVTPNATNTINTGPIQGLAIGDFNVTITLNNPTSNNSATITYTA